MERREFKDRGMDMQILEEQNARKKENAGASSGATVTSHSRIESLLRGIKLLNVLGTAALFIACWELFYRSGTNVQKSILFCGFYAVAYAWLGRIYNAFHIDLLRISEVLYSLTLASALTAVMVYVGLVVVRLQWANPLPLLGLLAVELVWNLCWSYGANRLYFKLNRPKRTIVIYRDEADLAKLNEIRNLSAKYRVERYVKNPTQIQSLLEEMEGYEAAFVAGIPATLRNGVVKYCVERDVEAYAMPHVGDVIMAGARHMQMYSVPVMKIMRACPVPEYLAIKRGMDIAVSLMGLIVLSPVIAVTALAIRLYDGGPVIYRQTRLTKDGREFEIWKFRSMIANAEGDGVARLASEHDDRITPVGRIIRACRIDEIPQLFNILKGDMSIVGPRPERPEIAAQYEEEIPAFALRLQVKAGLTGLAQIYGRYNTTPYDKLQMDLMYINRMSIFEDIRLMFATVKVLFQKESTSGIGENSITALNPMTETHISGGGILRRLALRCSANLTGRSSGPVIPAVATEGWWR